MSNLAVQIFSVSPLDHVASVALGFVVVLERPRKSRRHSIPFPFSVKEYSFEPQPGELLEEEFDARH